MKTFIKHISAILGILVLGVVFVGSTLAAGVGGGRAQIGVDAAGLYRVDGNTTNLHRTYFRRGDTVDISLEGDGSSDLDLYVYDEYGNLCARSSGPVDEEDMSLDIYRSGYFTIKVANRGWVYNDYSLSVEVY